MEFSGLDKDGKRKWVELGDLTLMSACWMLTENEITDANCYCADFNAEFSGLDKDGKRKWVELGDLTIMSAHWMLTETQLGSDTCLDCP